MHRNETKTKENPVNKLFSYQELLMTTVFVQVLPLRFTSEALPHILGFSDSLLLLMIPEKQRRNRRFKRLIEESTMHSSFFTFSELKIAKFIEGSTHFSFETQFFCNLFEFPATKKTTQKSLCSFHPLALKIVNQNLTRQRLTNNIKNSPPKFQYSFQFQFLFSFH
jgi:hypothetical protein